MLKPRLIEASRLPVGAKRPRQGDWPGAAPDDPSRGSSGASFTALYLAFALQRPVV
jgi:hypothetical protein